MATPTLDDYALTSGTWAGAFTRVPAGNINWYFMFAAMFLSNRFTSAQMLAAVALAVDKGVVGRRVSSATYANPTLCVFASGKVFMCNIGGVAAGSEPSDAGVTMDPGFRFLGDGTITWEYTGFQVPVDWNWFLLDVDSGYFFRELPDSTDAYAGVMAAACAKGAPPPAWLSTASAHPSGAGTYRTRLQVIGLVMTNCVADEIGSPSRLARTFQGGNSGAGVPYAIRFNADNCEAWSGAVGMVELYRRASDTASRAAWEGHVETLTAGIRALYDAASARFVTYHGQTPEASPAFVSDGRFHIWPVLHGVVETGPLDPAFGEDVVAYLEAAEPGIWTGALDDFVMAEFYFAVAKRVQRDPARNTLIRRVEERAPSYVSVTDAALYLEALEMAAVDICNLALDDLKADPIDALDATNARSRMMVRQYSTARDELLSSYPWAFALTRATVDGNVLTYARELDNAAWTKTRSTVTANAADAPDGTRTADKIVEDNTSSNTHVVSQAHTTTAGRVYKARARFKYVDRQYAHISLLTGGGFGSGAYAIFDIQNGDVAAQSGTFVEDTPTIDALGDGWYECEIAVVAASAASSTVTFGPSGAASTSYSGDAASSVYAWKLQLIERLYPEHTWTYKWALPSDCLSFWQAEDQGFANPLKVEGGYVNTEEESLDILYFKQETDTTKFHPLFTAALVKLLAWRCGYAITGSNARSDQLRAEYMEQLMQARAVNAILAGTPDEIVSDTFIAARY